MQPSESTPSASQSSWELKHDSWSSADSSSQLGIQVLSRFFLESSALGVHWDAFRSFRHISGSGHKVHKGEKCKRNERKLLESILIPFGPEFQWLFALHEFDDAASSKWHLRWQWSLAALLADLVGSPSLRHQSTWWLWRLNDIEWIEDLAS